MSISFRCQVCGKKMRVPSDFALKETRCKCGALIGDACELMCVWSPLFAELQDKNDRPIPAGPRHPVLIVFASFLVVFCTGLGLAQFLRSARNEAKGNHSEVLADSKKPHQQTLPSGARPPVQTRPPDPAPQPQPPTPFRPPPSDPGPEPETPVKSQSIPPQVVLTPIAAYLSSGTCGIGSVLSNTLAQSQDRAITTVAAFSGFLAEKFKAVEKIEIVEWYVARRYDVVEVPGKPKEPLVLNENAVKAGFVLVAVNVRLRSALLKGKSFDVLEPDTRLITPAKEDNSFVAFGCSATKTLWFAPPEGKYPYNPGKEEFVVQGWVFPVPRADLEAGRVQLQFRNEPPILMKLEKRRKEMP